MEINGEIGMPKFKPGEIHNPLGRPKNTGHRQQAFNALVLPHKESLFAKAIELALAGNEPMLRLFLERMIPAKPIDEPINLDISGELTLEESMEMGKKVLNLLAQQIITPKEAESLYSVVKYYQENIAIVELRALVDQLHSDFKKQQTQSPVFLPFSQSAKQTNDTQEK